jgi:hypothetical protein
VLDDRMTVEMYFRDHVIRQPCNNPEHALNLAAAPRYVAIATDIGAHL